MFFDWLFLVCHYARLFLPFEKTQGWKSQNSENSKRKRETQVLGKFSFLKNAKFASKNAKCILKRSCLCCLESMLFLKKNSTKHLKNSSKKLKNSQKLIEVQKSLPYGNSCLNNVMSVIAGWGEVWLWRYDQIWIIGNSFVVRKRRGKLKSFGVWGLVISAI